MIMFVKTQSVQRLAHKYPINGCDDNDIKVDTHTPPKPLEQTLWTSHHAFQNPIQSIHSCDPLAISISPGSRQPPKCPEGGRASSWPKMSKDKELQLKSAPLPTHLAFWCEAGLCSCPRSWGPLLTSDSGQSPGLSPVALDGFQYITNQGSPHAISSPRFC